MKRKKGGLRWLYIVSIVVHAAAGLLLALIPRKQLDEIVNIVLADVVPREEPAPPEPPPEPARPSEAARAPAAAPRRASRAPRPNPMPPSTAQLRAAQASNAETVEGPRDDNGGVPGADFGIVLGSDGAGVGMAVPLAGDGAGSGGSRPRVVAVARQLAPVRRDPPLRGRIAAGCVEEPTRPRPVHVPRPEYPDSARSAGVGGKVRVRLTIDRAGNVASARVLSGPDSGLHQAALSAARAARFEPSLRCGTPIEGTFTLGVRFAI